MKNIGVLLFISVFIANTALADTPFNGNQTADGSSAVSQAGASSYAQGSVGDIISGNVNIQSSQPIPYLPGTLGAPVLSPTLFNILGRPAQINGIPLLAKNLYPIDVHEVAAGASMSTKIIYNGYTPPRRAESRDRKLMYVFSGQAYGQIIGSITIQSKKNKGDEVDLPTLVYDAAQYIASRRDLAGYNITLLTMPQGVSFAMGVDSKGRGFSMSPLVSGLINGPAGVLAGMASGFADSKGVTMPTGLVGCTFFVVAETENSAPIDLNTRYTEDYTKDIDSRNGNGNGRKKYEATKEE